MAQGADWLARLDQLKSKARDVAPLYVAAYKALRASGDLNIAECCILATQLVNKLLDDDRHEHGG
jgi:hypothetical protein